MIDGDLKDSKGLPCTEEAEMWFRDPVDCVRELLANPSFCHETTYGPERTYRVSDKKEKVREYGEMSSADWWWEKQVRNTRYSL